MDSDEMYQQARGYKDHGKSYDAVYCREPGPGFRWLLDSFGTNWRLEKAFPLEWRPKSRLPIARELGETSLMFLVHPTLTPEDVAVTCDVVKHVMHEATSF